MQITFKGTPVNTVATLPAVGSKSPNFTLVKSDLSEVSLESLGAKKKLLNIFPSVDTGVCAASVKAFYEKLATMPNVVGCNISKDLPFALGRHCAASSLKSDNLMELSDFRGTFASDYGVLITSSVLRGLCSRAVVVLSENNEVLYTQQVGEIGEEPDYDKALVALQ